jgi:hypothetical protein
MYVILGIVAASVLGYILPVAIYLKTHEEKVRQMLVSLGLWDCSLEADFEYDVDSEEQSDFESNTVFFVILGVFGVCSLMVGLMIELMSVFGVGNHIDPSVNY